MENQNEKNLLDNLTEHIIVLTELRKICSDTRDKLRREKSPMELDADPYFNETIKFIEWIDQAMHYYKGYLVPKRHSNSMFPKMRKKDEIVNLLIERENIRNMLNSIDDKYLEKLKENVQYELSKKYRCNLGETVQEILSKKCLYNLQCNPDISESTDDDEPDESFSIPAYKRNEELKLHKIVATGNVAAPYRLTYTCSNSNDKASREVTCYFMKSIKPSFIDDDVDKYHKIFTTENVCPVCGAHDGSCVCDPDDDTEYDEYTKEEMMAQLMKELE